MSEGELANRNGWHEWSKYVLATLERHESLLDGLDQRLDTIERARSSETGKRSLVIGIIGSAIPIILAAIGWYFASLKS